MTANFSSIICIADMNITEALDQCLSDLGLPEVFVQPAKQMSLVDHQGYFGFRSGTRLEENRAVIYRMYVPSEYETGVMHRIAETTDLKMGGRGSIFAQHINYNRGTPLSFDYEKLDKLCDKADKLHHEEHVLVSCIVPRGGIGDSLAQAILELGVCVPIIFFGTGVGLRDKLGLLRITIPVEKEIIWFIVPRFDAEYIEKTLISRARLNIPGQGFLYKCFIYAPVVNLRVRQGKRVHAATMEQVIAALDEVHGSSDWRRFGSRHTKSGSSEGRNISSRGLFFIGEEEEADTFRRTAMENGAQGATLNELEMRSYSAQGQTMVSHSRQLCDIVVSHNVEEKLKSPISRIGLFDYGKSCVLKSFNVEMPSVIRRG
ncbi:MAG: hypothetical protein LBH07_05405 [Treponema sp.]|jgi:hypothetical protein|nr:hypothetical protein [Treponema sp.]